jgi:hypothetical protein
MKKPLLFLALSLAANAALIVTLVVHPFDRDRGATSPGPAGSTGKSAQADLHDTPGTGLSPADALALKRSGQLIAAGGDLHALVAQLRAAGFPPAIVRSIIMAQVSQQFGLRRMAVVAHQPEMPDWKFSTTGPFPYDPKAGHEIDALGREQTALVKELLGPDAAAPDAWSQLIRQRKYGNLDPDKIDRLETITSDYADLRKEITVEARGIFLPEDQQKIALIEKEQRADIVKLFTPEELEDYDLRTSNTAQNLRYQLSAFNPTEEEFRTIFNLTQAAQQANQNPQNAIEAALGPDRAAEYQQAISPAYQQVNLLLTRLELPASIAPQIVAVQQDIQQRAAALQQDQTLSADDRTNQLAALAQEAQTTLTSTLGTRGYEAYKNFGGWWLNNLTRRPAPRIPSKN